jgi:hypothetical protein
VGLHTLEDFGFAISDFGGCLNLDLGGFKDYYEMKEAFMNEGFHYSKFVSLQNLLILPNPGSDILRNPKSQIRNQLRYFATIGNLLPTPNAFELTRIIGQN